MIPAFRMRIQAPSSHRFRAALRPAGPMRTGITLIETIAALVVLAIAIPPLLFGLADQSRHRADMVQISVARRLAAERIEEVTADRYATGRGFDWLVESNYPDEAAVDGFPAFSRQVRFTDLGPDLEPGGDDIRLIEVTISWVRAGGATQELALRTIVTEFTP